MNTTAESARDVRALTVLGAACFGGGLLVTAVGVLLLVLGILQGPWFLLPIGIGTVLAGLSASLWGMVLLYRSLIRSGTPPVVITDDAPENSTSKESA